MASLVGGDVKSAAESIGVQAIMSAAVAAGASKSLGERSSIRIRDAFTDRTYSNPRGFRFFNLRDRYHGRKPDCGGDEFLFRWRSSLIDLRQQRQHLFSSDEL